MCSLSHHGLALYARSNERGIQHWVGLPRRSRASSRLIQLRLAFSLLPGVPADSGDSIRQYFNIESIVKAMDLLHGIRMPGRLCVPPVVYLLSLRPLSSTDTPLIPIGTMELANAPASFSLQRKEVSTWVWISCLFVAPEHAAPSNWLPIRRTLRTGPTFGTSSCLAKQVSGSLPSSTSLQINYSHRVPTMRSDARRSPTPMMWPSRRSTEGMRPGPSST